MEIYKHVDVIGHAAYPQQHTAIIGCFLPDKTIKIVTYI